MAVVRTMGYQFMTEEADKGHDLAADSLIICLMNTAFAFNPATHSTYADISASEIATGFGYTQKTKELANVAVTETATGCTVSCDSPSWTAAAGDFPAVGSAVVINDTHGNDTVILCIDFGADYTTTDGTIFQIDFTNGLFTKANSA
jgi:hypothetical protein